MNLFGLDEAKQWATTAEFRALPTKAAKMRALEARGASRADIARVLDVRYQQVRQTLNYSPSARSADSSPAPQEAGPRKLSEDKVLGTIGANGALHLPSEFRDALDLAEGTEVIVRLDGDEIRIMTPLASMRRAQKMVRDLIPAHVDLVSDLLEDRRREGKEGN